MSEPNEYSHAAEAGVQAPRYGAFPLDSRRARRERSRAAVAELARAVDERTTDTSTLESAPTAVVFSDEVPVGLHLRLIALSGNSQDGSRLAENNNQQ